MQSFSRLACFQGLWFSNPITQPHKNCPSHRNCLKPMIPHRYFPIKIQGRAGLRVRSPPPPRYTHKHAESTRTANPQTITTSSQPSNDHYEGGAPVSGCSSSDSLQSRESREQGFFRNPSRGVGRRGVCLRIRENLERGREFRG